MTQFQRAFEGFALLAILAALIIAAIVGVSVYRRERHLSRAIVWMIFAGSLTCAAGVTLQPGPGPAGVELVPFTNLNSPSGMDQLIANLVLLGPTGLALGLLQPLRHAVIVGLCLGAGFELVQLLLPMLGRVAATEDFLLNAIGFVAGAGGASLGRSLWTLLPKAGDAESVPAADCSR